LGVTTKELALVIGGVVADATAWATLGARVAIGAACAAAAVLVVHRNHWSWRWAAALAVPVMALGGIGGWWTQSAFATPAGPQPRKDCTSVDMAETDPGLRTKQHLTCAKGVLTRAVWDLDTPDGIWVQPLTAHPPTSSDLIIDDSGVRVGPGAKLVTTTEDRLSYSDCTDQEVNPEIAFVSMADIAKVHGLCIRTNGQRRALVKIDEGGPLARPQNGPLAVHVMVWQKRNEERVQAS
jgi:hypothetical protein